MAPIVNPMGIIGFISYVLYMMDYWLYCSCPQYTTYEPEFPVEILGKISFTNGFIFLGLSIFIFIVGVIFGIKAYRYDIPLRWSWAKSKNDVFSFSLSTIVGYAFYFVAYPYAIFMVYLLFFAANLR